MASACALSPSACDVSAQGHNALVAILIDGNRLSSRPDPALCGCCRKRRVISWSVSILQVFRRQPPSGSAGQCARVFIFKRPFLLFRPLRSRFGANWSGALNVCDPAGARFLYQPAGKQQFALEVQLLPATSEPRCGAVHGCMRPHTCIASWFAVSWYERRRACYGSETIDRIGFCRRAGFQRRGGRYCGSHRATAHGSREAGASAQPQPCVDFRIPPLGWQRLRLERGKVGTAATAACPLGSPSLGSPETAAMSWSKGTGVGPLHGELHMPADGVAGMWPSNRPRAATMIRFLLSAMLLCQAHGYAQSGPQPPCGMDPVPPYPGLDSPPTVKFWSESDLGRDWRPPACTGWSEAGFSTLITTAARFRYTSGAEGLLRHIGAVSELAGMRYWSTTHQQWQTLIVNAHALTGPQPSSPPPGLHAR